MKRYLRIALIAALVAGLIPVLLLISIFAGLFGHLQTRQELLNFRNAEASVVLSAGGDHIGKFLLQNRTNISYEEIPLHLRNALIATEDARFLEHKGIDTRSLFRVLVKSIILNNRRSGGGSTITQQLAKNMFGRREYWPFTVIVNKVKEAILAYRLEETFSKEEILTLYLNTVPFGENIYGIESAAGRFFNKSTKALTNEESAVLIGMLKANTFYNPRLNPANALNRRNVVIRQMERYDYLSTRQADSICSLPMILDPSGYESGGPADYFLTAVRSETEKILKEVFDTTGRLWDPNVDGLIITTTLNLPLQKMALASFREHLSVMQQRLERQYNTNAGKREIDRITADELKRLNLEDRAEEMGQRQLFTWKGIVTDSLTVSDSLKKSLLLLHAGLLAIDPSDGAVRAWVGGIDFRTQPYDQIYARRQLASVFKPVVYAAAFENGREPCDYLDNDSLTLSEYEDWSPENYDHSFGGRYSLAGALAHSMNLPAISLYLDLGYPVIDSMWKRLGFTFPLEDHPSLALGTGEASIREVAVAYSAFANGGYRVKPQFITSIREPGGGIIYQNDLSYEKEKILSERSALLISAILQKATREGTGASMNSTYMVGIPMAGKTGTSQSYADAWFASFNPGLTIVARVGASTQTVHFNSGEGSGAALALPLVAMTLQKAEKDRAVRDQLFRPFPLLPPELERALDCPDYRDKKLIFKFLDIFKRRDASMKKVEPTPESKPEKKSLFKRIFNK